MSVATLEKAPAASTLSIPYVLHVHVIPKSAKNQVLGWAEDPAGDRWLKVRIAATADDGAANKELIKFLAKTLETPVKNVKLVKGEASRYKTVKIEGHLDLSLIGL